MRILFLVLFTVPLFIYPNENKTGLLVNSEAVFFAKKVKDLWCSNPDSAILIAQQGIEATSADAQPSDLGYLRLVYANALNISGKRDSALQEFEASKQLFKKAGNDFLYHRAHEQIGCVYREIGNYEKSIEHLKTALDYFLKVEDKYQVHSTYLNIGASWLDKGKYNLALDAYLKAMENNNSQEDTVSTALNYLGVGLVYYNLGRLYGTLQHEKTMHYFEQALYYIQASEDLFSSIGHTMGVCYACMNKGAVFAEQKNFKQLEKILSSCEICYRIADKRVNYAFKGLEAVIFEEKNDLTSAKHIRLEIDRESKNVHFPYAFYDNKLSLARVYYQLGKHDSAFIYAKTAIDWFDDKGSPVYALNGHKMLLDWYLSQNNYVLAFVHAQKANERMESVFSDITSEVFDEVQLKYQKQMMELELNTIKNEQKAVRLRFILALLVLLFGLLLFLSLALYSGIKRRKALLINILSEQKILKLEQESVLNDKVLCEQKLSNALLEEQALTKQLELQMKEQELLYQSVKNAELLQIARTIHEKMSPFQLKIAKKKDQESYSQSLTEITKMANQEILADFDAVFASMHKDFREKILALAPDLTPGEMQMCALLRMNLSSKEIARLNNISSASVDLMRHKIRQKLDLNQQQNLTSFLIALD